jgi:hypothetical protein
MPTWTTWISWGVSILNFMLNLFGKKPATAAPAPDPFAQGKEAGTAEQSAADAQAALKVETAIAQGEAQAPTTQAEIVAEMQQGKF